MVVAPRTPDRFCTAPISTYPSLHHTAPPNCRVPSLVLPCLPCVLFIQPTFSRRDLRRRTRPAANIVVTGAQSDCDIRSLKQQSNASNITSSSQRRRTPARRLTRYSASKRRTAIQNSKYHPIYKDRVDLVAERPHPPIRSSRVRA